MNLVTDNEVGYSIRDKEGKLSLKKFINTLDWSLDTIKLQDEYRKETRRRDFYFLANGKKYTQVVINVTFSYSYKEFNQSGKNTYIRAGYLFRDCPIQDGVYVKDGKLIAIQTNVEINNPISQEILGNYFTFADGYYKQINTIPVIMKKSDLRQYLYEHGFVCDGTRYVRYKRSSGSSRVGKCLFVNAAVADRMTRWDKCGLTFKENDDIDLAAWEAYISLPMSSIIDTMQIKPENILLVDDFMSTFKDSVISVEAQNGKLVAQEKTMDITNNIWDGESLMDISLFGEYANKGMLLLRNRFFKTCAFNTNIAKFFEDNNITSVKQLNGFTLATDISDIKLITTPSSVKYLKFGTAEQWLKNIDSTFGIVKYEKETHYFDGRMVQCHYQLLNTLQLSYETMEKFLAPSLNYVAAVRADPDVLRYHIGYPFRVEEDEEVVNPLKSKNDIVFKMLGINNNFANTQLYKDFRSDIIKGYIRNLKQGHVLLNGNYSTLFGNGYELLMQSIGKYNGENYIGKGNICSSKFSFGKTILASRSPHITMGNILLVKNVENAYIAKYFNLTNEIVCVNSIGENNQQRLNGQDFDSDTVLLTDNEILIEAAQKNYEVFKVPTCCVESQKMPRKYNTAHKADLDIRTSVNKIGEIVNLSQYLNSLLWERLNKGETIESCSELYNDICKLAVLSGIEIDKAKKEFVVNSINEIAWLREKYKEGTKKQVRPIFFKTITIENGYKLTESVTYRKFDTAMDYLQQIVTIENNRQSHRIRSPKINFMDVVKQPTSGVDSGYYWIRRNKVIEVIRKAKEDIRKLYIDYDLKSPEEKTNIWNQVAERRQECINLVNKMSESEYTMYLVLKELDNKEYKDVCRFIFEILFGSPNEAFFKLIEASKEPMYELVEEREGNIKLFDFNYVKRAVA